jgi:hypothetical protein
MDNSKKFIISSLIIKGDYGHGKTNGSKDGKDANAE